MKYRKLVNVVYEIIIVRWRKNGDGLVLRGGDNNGGFEVVVVVVMVVKFVLAACLRKATQEGVCGKLYKLTHTHIHTHTHT